MWSQLRAWFVIVVLGAALVIIVVGALSHAREQARRASCVSNLYAFGLTYALYADFNQGRCPVDAKITLAGTFRLLTNLTSSGRIFFCPSDRRPHARPESDLSKLTPLNISYSYVPNLLWQGGSTNTILWLDRIYTMRKGDKWAADSNHGVDGGNVAFTDGHVGFFHELPADLVDKDGQPIVLSP